MNETMTHPNSLENLKLGAAARRKGKVKLNLTVLPETAEKLKRSGNASRFVELLVQAHEVSWLDLVLHISNFRNTPTRQNVNPFFFILVSVEDERFLA